MRRLSHFGVFFILLSLVFLANRFPALTGAFQIDPSSQLRLEGSTNVNRFSCNCVQDFPKDTYEIVRKDNASILEFSNTDFRVSTDKLDCGKKLMNNDLRKALKSEEFPYILIELESMRLPEGSGKLKPGEWISLPVTTHITIAGARKKVNLEVDAKALGDDTYLICSEKVLAMSDFGIEAPKPMLGMIKVDDEITINFDLKVKL